MMDSFLLCPPDYFTVDYSINPWMTGEAVDTKIAIFEWLDLVMKIQKSGAEVKTMKPVYGLPDMVFTANCGIVHENVVVLSNMKHIERQGEKKHFEQWFLEHGYDVVNLLPSAVFEGCGDALVHDKVLIGGFGFRSNLLGLEITADVFGLELISLQLVDPRYYHLDTCFCKVSETHAIYYPNAFKHGEIEKLKGVIELIPVPEIDVRKFMCNSMLVNNTLLIPARETETELTLNTLGIKTVHVGVQEFLKSGGSIQCLCLKL
jgi:N-dimethylarginine dimethylaminohydrolase